MPDKIVVKIVEFQKGHNTLHIIQDQETEKYWGRSHTFSETQEKNAIGFWEREAAVTFVTDHPEWELKE